MARKTPFTANELATCKAMKALRLALKIPRTDFAPMVGIGTENLATKEAGRNCFKDAELARIKSVVENHLTAGFEALRALPF